MKTLLFAAVLALASWSSQAAPVTASTDQLALPPTLMPGDSPWLPVTFTNNTDQHIELFGTGSDGPFGSYFVCPELGLPPHGTCTLYVRFQPREGQPLGLAEGIVGFRLATGTIIADLVGFSYGNDPLPGVRNLQDSIQPLGFTGVADAQLRKLLDTIEHVLLDGRPNNDRSACGRLKQFIRLVEREAAIEGVSEWSAVAAIVQAEAVGASLGCHVAAR